VLGCSAGMVATGLTSPGPAPNGWCSRGVWPADTHTHILQLTRVTALTCCEQPIQLSRKEGRQAPRHGHRQRNCWRRCPTSQLFQTPSHTCRHNVEQHMVGDRWVL